MKPRRVQRLGGHKRHCSRSRDRNPLIDVRPGCAQAPCNAMWLQTTCAGICCVTLATSRFAATRVESGCIRKSTSQIAPKGWHRMFCRRFLPATLGLPPSESPGRSLSCASLLALRAQIAKHDLLLPRSFLGIRGNITYVSVAVLLLLMSPSAVSQQQQSSSLESAGSLLSLLSDLAAIERLEDYDAAMKRMGFTPYSVHRGLFNKDGSEVIDVNFPPLGFTWIAKPKEISRFSLRLIVDPPHDQRVSTTQTGVWLQLEFSQAIPCIDFSTAKSRFGSNGRVIPPRIAPRHPGENAASAGAYVQEWSDDRFGWVYTREVTPPISRNHYWGFRFNFQDCMISFTRSSPLSPVAATNAFKESIK